VKKAGRLPAPVFVRNFLAEVILPAPTAHSEEEQMVVPTDFDRELARTNPKRQFEALFEKGRGPKNLSSFLDQLTREEEEEVCHKAPMPKVIAFIVNNLPLAHGG
jgi:hypothetical protein